MSIRNYMKSANLKFNGQLKKRASTSGIVLHHAAVSETTPQEIHEWHLKKGWMGAGYNVYVRKDGSVWELRPLWAVGAHAEGANSESIGVCAEGMYHPSDSQPYDKEMPKVQFNAMVKVVKDLIMEYPSIKWIKGHGEMPGSVTACPGDYFPLKEIIQTAVSGSNVEGVNSMKKGDRGPTVEMLQRILIELGYSLPKYGADGVFGSETEVAVNAFKKSAGLPQDGIVDISAMIAMAERLLQSKTGLEKENAHLKNQMQALEVEAKKAAELASAAEKRALQAEERNKRCVEFFKLLNQLAKEMGQ